MPAFAGLGRVIKAGAWGELTALDRNRAERRRSGKSDPLDAVEAARAALGGRAKSISKSKDGAVEAIRVLVVAKRSARGARVKALTQMRHLVITARLRVCLPPGPVLSVVKPLFVRTPDRTEQNSNESLG